MPFSAADLALLIFLVATIADGEAAVHDALGRRFRLRAIGFRDPTKHFVRGRLDTVRRLGPSCCRTRPTELHPFAQLQTDHGIPPRANPAIPLLHIPGRDHGRAFRVGWGRILPMGDAVTVVDEVHGFRFFCNRDRWALSPKPAPNRHQGHHDGDEDRNFAGSCWCTCSMWHDKASWESLLGHRAGVCDRPGPLRRHELDDNASRHSHVAPNITTTTVLSARSCDTTCRLAKSACGRVRYLLSIFASPTVTEQMPRNMLRRSGRATPIASA